MWLNSIYVDMGQDMKEFNVRYDLKTLQEIPSLQHEDTGVTLHGDQFSLSRYCDTTIVQRKALDGAKAGQLAAKIHLVKKYVIAILLC